MRRGVFANDATNARVVSFRLRLVHAALACLVKNCTYPQGRSKSTHLQAHAKLWFLIEFVQVSGSSSRRKFACGGVWLGAFVGDCERCSGVPCDGAAAILLQAHVLRGYFVYVNSASDCLNILLRGKLFRSSHSSPSDRSSSGRGALSVSGIASGTAPCRIMLSPQMAMQHQRRMGVSAADCWEPSCAW